MCAIDYDLEGALEAGLKYLIVGSFGSAGLLFGSALVYGATNKIGSSRSRRRSARRAVGRPAARARPRADHRGHRLKASAAPFHMWTPTCTRARPTPVTAFMSAATKVAALVLGLRLLQTAFPQEAHLWTARWRASRSPRSRSASRCARPADVKRMLAYSSISHAGFMLIGVSVARRSAAGRSCTTSSLCGDGVRLVRRCRRTWSASSRGGHARQPSPASAGSGRSSALRCGSSCSAFAGLPLGGGFLGKFLVFAAAYRHGGRGS